jgi:hypothetical protein
MDDGMRALSRARRLRLRATVGAAIAGVAMAACHAGAGAAEAIRLSLPVGCEVGTGCHVQQYVDHDPSAAARDFTCGSMTYDAHNGTDFRLPTRAVQRAGVSVLAAAKGRVARIRDGMPDVSIRDAEAAGVDGQECGNGLLIEHGNGWQTQYCHLARGSLQVAPGDAVEAGQVVGQVGLSGRTEFPHLHFTVRHQGKVVDPFAFGLADGACGGGDSLWDEDVRPQLAYRPGALLNTGFAAGPVSMDSIESGDAGRHPPGADAPAVVAFARAIGLRAGDVQRLTIAGPDGRIIVDQTQPPLPRHQAQTMMFAGKRRPASGWESGTYRATYRVQRGDAPVLEARFELTF